MFAGVSALGMPMGREGEREPSTEYTSWRCRYEHRFSAFAHVQQPPLLDYDEFTNSVQNLAPTTLLESAAECFRQCKTLIDRACRALPGESEAEVKARQPPSAELAELRTLAKVAVANGVAIAQLTTQRVGAGSGMCAQFDFTAHPLFPSVTVRAMAKPKAPCR